MPIYTRCSSCGGRVPAGTTCQCRKKREAKRQQLYDQYGRDRQAHGFYNSAEWIMARNQALIEDQGIDVYVYMTEGKVLIADMVHHIVPLRDNYDKRIDINNLMSLNHNTHGKIEKMYKKNKSEMIVKLSEMVRQYRKLNG